MPVRRNDPTALEAFPVVVLPYGANLRPALRNRQRVMAITMILAKNNRLDVLIRYVTNQDKTEKDKDGKYIRKERYYGSYQRSFYVGDGVTQDDIKGGFENGILTLTVPKKEAKPAVEEKKYISIEG